MLPDEADEIDRLCRFIKAHGLRKVRRAYRLDGVSAVVNSVQA